jgi:hypothetical protein
MSFYGQMLKALKIFDIEFGHSNGINLSGTYSASSIRLTGDCTYGIYMNANSMTNPFYMSRTNTATTGTITDVNIAHTEGADSMSKKNETLRVSYASEYYTGDWVNAIVGRIDYGANGDARGGMAAAICAQMNMPTKSYTSIGGPCYSLDCEFNCPTNFVAGERQTYPIGFIKFGLGGGAKGEFDDEGYIFHTDGLTAAAGHVLGAGSTSLRVNIEGSDKYIPLLPADGVSGAALNVGGTYNYGINFEAAPAVGANYSFINVGTYDAALDVALSSANKFGVMHNVELTSSAAHWYHANYTKITTSGTTTLSSVAGHTLQMVIGSDLDTVYGIQCQTNLSGAAEMSTEAISVSAYVQLTTGAITTDRVCALQAMIEGAGGTVTGDSIVAYIVNAGTASDTDAILELKNQSACTVTTGLVMNLDGTCTYAFHFDGTVSDDWTSGDGAVTQADEYAMIPVKVNGVTPTLYLLAAETWA